MATYTAPSSFDEFVRQYDHFIDVSLYRISRGSLRPADLPDFKQAVYARLIETGYLDRYAPDKGSFSNYLYVLVRSVAANIFDRNSRTPTNLAFGIARPGAVRRARGSDAESNGSFSIDTLPVFQDRSAEQRLTDADVVARLHQYAEASRDGAELTQVLQLLYEGLTPTEIAARTGRPASRITKCRKKLRAILTGPLQHRAVA